MPPEVVSILGTLGAVLVGGFISYLAGKSTKKHEWRLSIARERAASNQQLYAEFLVEAERLVMEEREDKISSLSDQSPMKAKFAEVCLVASGELVAQARTLADYALTSHSAQSSKEVADFPKLKQAFISAARQDIARTLGDA